MYLNSKLPFDCVQILDLQGTSVLPRVFLCLSLMIIRDINNMSLRDRAGRYIELI